MKTLAACGALRAAKVLVFSAVLLTAGLLDQAAFAQIAPPTGVEPGTPGVSMPEMAPPIAPPSAPSKSPGVSAPLATSQAGCQADIGKLQSRRMAVLQELTKIAKENKGKLNPVTACPKFRSLVAVETQFRNYLIENKAWCSIPGQVVDTVKQSTAKDMQTAGRACQLAAQFKKAQAQAAQGLGGAPQAPHLPAGPL